MGRIICLCIIILSITSPAFAQTQWTEPIAISETDIRCEAADMVAAGESLFVVYYNPLHLPKWPRFVRSTDCGATWAAPFVFTDSLLQYGIQPDIHCVGDTLHVVFSGSRFRQNPRVFYLSSSDAGANWGPLQTISNPHTWTRYAEIGLSRGQLTCVYTSTVRDIPYSDTVFIMGVSSPNGGRNWGTPYRISPNVNATYLMTLLQSRGRFHLIYGLSGQGALEIGHISSDDGGLNWSLPRIISPVDSYAGQWPRAGIDSTGTLAATWFDYKYGSGGGGTYGDILGNLSPDNGFGWFGELRVSYEHQSLTSSVAIDSPNVYVAYEDIRDGNAKIFFRWSSDLGQSWAPEEKLTDDDSLSCYDPELTISLCNGVKTLHFVWSQAPNSLRSSSTLYYSHTQAPTAIAEGDRSPWSTMPDEIEIISAYPNPFNSSTTITVSGMAGAEIGIYDITGRRLALLQAHDGRAVWEAGERPSGMYFARVMTESSGRALRLVLVK